MNLKNKKFVIQVNKVNENKPFKKKKCMAKFVIVV